MPNLEVVGRFRDAGKILVRIPLRGEARSILLGRTSPSPEDIAAGHPVGYPNIVAAGITVPETVFEASELQYRIQEEDEG